MSNFSQYLHYFLYGGDFSKLPKPTSTNGALLYDICKKGGTSEEKLNEAVQNAISENSTIKTAAEKAADSYLRENNNEELINELETMIKGRE